MTAPVSQLALRDGFESAVVEAVRAGRPGVLVDLARWEAFDSRDLARLVAADKAVRSAGGRMALARATPEAQRLLELSGLDAHLELHASRASAARALGGLRSSPSPGR